MESGFNGRSAAGQEAIVFGQVTFGFWRNVAEN
jgi:hypothetical protein